MNETTDGPALHELILEDWIAHERDWTRPGFLAMAVYRFGCWRMGVRPVVIRKLLSPVYYSLFRYVRNHYGIELPDTASIGRRVIIEHQGDIVIHGNACIGDDCIVRQGVTIGNRHPARPTEAPVLGKRVNIGAGAKILGAIIVGDGTNIGANAVVCIDVPAGATAVGVPAQIVGPISRAKRTSTA